MYYRTPIGNFKSRRNLVAANNNNYYYSVTCKYKVTFESKIPGPHFEQNWTLYIVTADNYF